MKLSTCQQKQLSGFARSVLCSLLMALAALHSAYGQTPPPATLSPTPPLDVSIPSGFSGNPIVFFDDFSWRTFISLIWPADPSRRGHADTTKSIGDATVPVVWDTWKADFEIIHPDGSPPSKWDSFASSTPCPGFTDTKTKIIAAFSKFEPLSQAIVGGLGGPLVAQNQTYVRYEIRVNEHEFNTIASKQYFLRDHLPSVTGVPANFEDNSIEIKAAWRIMTAEDTPDIRRRFYVVPAIIYDPVKDVCVPEDMGLIGLHIVEKTPSRPQWIWASFEQVDNVPPAAGEQPRPAGVTAPFSLNDGLHSTVVPAMPPKALSSVNPPSPSPAAMQVVRSHRIAASTETTNRAYQTLLRGTVWENYQLVMTQWPTDATSADGAPFPGPSSPLPASNTANSTMETYFQDISKRGGSCMSCHFVAQSNDKIDFVWWVQIQAASPSPRPTAPAAAAIHQEELRQRIEIDPAISARARALAVDPGIISLKALLSQDTN